MDMDAEFFEALRLLSRELPEWDSMTLREQWNALGDYGEYCGSGRNPNHDRNFPRYVQIVAKMTAEDVAGKTGH